MKDLIKKQKGFTLVEMMVAIAVFSLVMVTAMSALLNVIDANNKARAIKTAVNNVNFALESISRNARLAIDYGCGDDGVPTGDCPTGGNIIRYRTARADKAGLMELDGDGNIKNKFVYYKFNEDENRLEECLEKGQTCDYTGPYTAITSSEVKITKARFYVLGTSDPRMQPRIIMTISGEAGSKEKTKTKFDLQTSISQRIRN